jgi:hypothetical protein
MRLLQPGGPGLCIYILLEQGGPVTPPGMGFTPWYSELELKLKLKLLPTVSWPVCFGVRPPFGVHDQIFVFCLTVACFLCEAPSLMRGWVCNLVVQMLLGLARAATLGSKFRRTRDHILLSHLRLPNLNSYTPGNWVPFSPPLTIHRLHNLSKLRSESLSDCQSVSQSVCLGLEPSWYS